MAAWGGIRGRLERVPPRWALVPIIGLAIGVGARTILDWPEVWYERGTDYGFFVAQAERFLAAGGFYEPRQLAGPYAVAVGIDNLYPPPALFLFVPFTILPGPLWWLIPIASIGWVIRWLRPAPWSWVFMALLAVLPRTQSIVLWGNTVMWITAFVGLGIRASWPSVLVLIKPYFVAFALIGVGRRAWFVGILAFAVLNVPLLPMWAEYLTAWRNAGASWPSWRYTPWDLLTVSIPIVAWLGRTSDRQRAVP